MHSPRKTTARNSPSVALVLLLTVPLGSVALRAQTKYPSLDWVYPLTVPRGATTEVEICFGGNVKTGYRALVEGEGVRAEVVARSEERKIGDDRSIVRLEVAADAPLGPRDIRLVTEEAVTTPGRIYVTHRRTVVEKGDHGTREKAQPIESPVVVNGRIEKAVEVDWYRFEGTKGERVNFEVIGTRLHETIQKIGRFTPHFDAFLSLTDASGRELAMNDDSRFADPLLSFVLPADGTYFLAMREAIYKGHIQYTYSLVATRGPLTTLIFPLAAAAGEETAVELVGPGLGAGEKARLRLPADATSGQLHLTRPRRPDGSDVDPISVLATALPTVMETEGIGESANNNFQSAQDVVLPAGIAGRIGKSDEVDCFAFEVKKGRKYRFEIFARRLFSPLDSELEIVRADGRVLLSGDDSKDVVGRRSRDTQLEWTAPDDGRHVLRIRDLHRRGGPGFLYHVECAPAEPDFELTFDPELAMVGPGNRTPIYVRAHRRHGFGGEIALEVEGLPAGVEAIAPSVRAGMNDACVVLAVAGDAGCDGSSFRIRGTATVKRGDGSTATLVREARPLVEIYQAQRVLGRTAGMAVTRSSDIEVTTTLHDVVLRPGESKVIPIKLIRGSTYASGSVSLWAMWRFNRNVFGSSLPPGVHVDEGKSRTGIIGEGVDGALALRADANAAPVSRVQTVVIALVPIEYSVFVPFCTRPILVTVTKKDGTVASAVK